jgi:hypothetical protein
MRTTTTTLDAADIGSRNPSRHGGLLAALTVALAAVTATAIVEWNQGPATHESTVSVFTPAASYAPDGSVYDSQIPQAARVGTPDLPGGSVYDGQVPAWGRSPTPPLGGVGPGPPPPDKTSY